MENSTKLQKANVEVEIYSNNKKCDWKKKPLKAYLYFIVLIKSTNKIEGGKKKVQKKLQNKSKYKKSKYFSWVTAVSVLSIAGSHSPPRPPGVPSNTVLVSGPAVGATQTLIWSYSCVFLPPVSTAVRTSAFSFVGALNVLLYIP